MKHKDLLIDIAIKSAKTHCRVSGLTGDKKRIIHACEHMGIKWDSEAGKSLHASQHHNKTYTWESWFRWYVSIQDYVKIYK